MGWRWKSRFTAPATASNPKMMKRAICIVSKYFQYCDCKCATRGTKPELRCAVSECQCRRQNVHHGDGKKKRPTKLHQLVIAEARQRGAHPDVKQNETEYLDDKPHHA